MKAIDKPKPIISDNTLYDNSYIRGVVLNRIKQDKPVFRIICIDTKSNLKKKETKIIISNNTILDPNNNIDKIEKVEKIENNRIEKLDKLFKPNKVNVGQGNIIINNYYSFINSNIDIDSLKKVQEGIITKNEVIYVDGQDLPKKKKNESKKKKPKVTNNETLDEKQIKTPKKRKSKTQNTKQEEIN